jgi:hypothetical protein
MNDDLMAIERTNLFHASVDLDAGSLSVAAALTRSGARSRRRGPVFPTGCAAGTPNSVIAGTGE